MRFVLILAALLCAPGIIAYAEIQQDVVERDTIGGTGSGGGGDLSAIDIDTFSELDAIVADEGLVNLNDAQTLMNKVIDGNSNTVKMLRHATDCTAYTGAVDGQYCWEQDDDVLYVCETADECDTAGEWDAVASAGDYLPLSGGTLSGDLLIGDNAAIRCESDNGCDLGSGAARFGPFYPTSILFANDNQGLIQRDAADSTYVSLIWLDNLDVINIGNGIEAGISLASPIPDSQVSHEPAGNIESTDVRDAINELDADKLNTSAASSTYFPISGGVFGGDITLHAQSLTIADSGDGNPATDTATPITGNILRVTCSDADGCNLTLSETSVVNGQYVKVENVSANTVNLVHSAGVAETCNDANYALNTTDKSVGFEYSTNVWKQDCETAIAFQTTPNSCDPGQFSTGISTNGDSTCDTVAGTDIAFDGVTNDYPTGVDNVEEALESLTNTVETAPNGATSWIPWPTLTDVPEFSIPTGTGPTVDGSPVNLAWDSTVQQLVGYGGASEVVVSTGGIGSECVTVEDIKAADDNMPIASWPYAVTITSVWCQYAGSAPTTPATFTLEDGDGNAMTIADTNPTCSAPTTEPTPKVVTAANALVAYEMVRFDTSNTPNPETDTYMLCISYTMGRQ